jgi:hypothetical protein
MQRGHLYQAHGAWHLRYRVNGKHVAVKLADYNDEYRTLKSLRPLAEPYLETANSGRQANEGRDSASRTRCRKETSHVLRHIDVADPQSS